MAAIIQADPYQSLIRKIGYSVGLEDIVNRIIALTDLYVEQRGLSYSAFNDLIEKDFGRKNATHHFGNFYGALNLVNLTGKEVHPLYNLDVLSILQRYYENDRDAFVKSSKIVILQALLESDGEIFLNALTSNFDPEKFKKLLRLMISSKREAIKKVIRSPQILKKIFFVIDIKSQSSKSTNSGKGKKNIESVSRFTARTEPLSETSKRREPLSGSISNEINIPDDYLKKVPVTRKSWAEALDLFGKNEILSKGFNLLDGLAKNLNLKQENDFYIFWPYQNDFMKLRIKPEDLGARQIKSWDLLSAIAEGLGEISLSNFVETFDYSSTIDLLYVFFELYKSANKGLEAIRHQLPLFVVEPCLTAVSIIESNPLPPLYDILAEEGKKHVRRIQIAIIRGTEGAIVFQKEK